MPSGNRTDSDAGTDADDGSNIELGDIDDAPAFALVDAPLYSGERRGCSKHLRSVLVFLALLVILPTVGCGLGAFFLYQSATDGPIADMAAANRAELLERISAFVSTFFQSRQDAVALLAANPDLAVGGNLVATNALLWATLHAMQDVWILTTMPNASIGAGYAWQGTAGTASWFGRWGAETQNGWQSRRGVALVNQADGTIDPTQTPSFQGGPQDTIWPRIWRELYNSSTYETDHDNLTCTPGTFYWNNLAAGGAPVDINWPEFGLQYTYVHPFVRLDGAQGFVSCVFNSRGLLQWMSTLDLFGGVLFLSDATGALTATSTPVLPVYGPGPNDSPPLPQKNGTNLPYFQFTYDTYPDEVVRAAGAAVAAAGGGDYAKAPLQAAALHARAHDQSYTVSTALLWPSGSEPSSTGAAAMAVRMVIAIPDSSFAGFTAEDRRNTVMLMVFIVAAWALVAVLLGYVFVVRPMTRASRWMERSVGSRRFKESLFHDSDTASDAGSIATTGALNSPRMGEEKRSLLDWAEPSEVHHMRGVADVQQTVLGGLARFLDRATLEAILLGNNNVPAPSSAAAPAPLAGIPGVRPGVMVHQDVSLLAVVVANVRELQREEPHVVAAVMSELNAAMGPVIRRARGHIVSRNDDWSLVAAWNAVDPVVRHGARAARAAFDVQTAIAAANARLANKYLSAPLAVHVGVHTGSPLVGIVGTGQLHYAVTGTDVDVARGLAQVAQSLDLPIACSQAIAALRYSEFALAPALFCGLHRVSGPHAKGNTTTVWRAVSALGDAEYAQRAEWTSEFAAFFDVCRVFGSITTKSMDDMRADAVALSKRARALGILPATGQGDSLDGDHVALRALALASALAAGSEPVSHYLIG